ncbi:MAG TPA: SOS response-associated peptidase family protein [Ramlibacter sp.]|nr:SOS response-associated peptidase family protein [Ramlibacter sp.]
MCSHYQAIKNRERYYRKFGVYPPPHDYVEDMWPRYMGAFIRRPPEIGSGDEAVPPRESVLGRWGLVPWATKDAPKQLKLSTFNARAEGAANSFTFGGAWRRGQRCIIPAEAIFEPDWRSGKHVPTRIARADGEPLGIAGLWDKWQAPEGPLLSFTMLTINADQHEFMCRFHRADEEKRMVVVLREADFDAWLQAPAERTHEFMRQCPPADLVALG